jgi:hypothetical protein
VSNPREGLRRILPSDVTEHGCIDHKRPTRPADDADSTNFPVVSSRISSVVEEDAAVIEDQTAIKFSAVISSPAVYRKNSGILQSAARGC